MPAKGKYLAIWGLGLQFGCVVGIIGTIVGMLRAFPKLANAGLSQTQDALASDMALALYSTAIGMAVSIVGIILLCIALFGVKYRAPWFKTAMWIMAILWLLSGPVGLVLGIITMLYLSNHKHEFTEQSGAGYPPQSVGPPDP